MASLDSLCSLDEFLSSQELVQFDDNLNDGIDKVIRSYKDKTSKLFSVIEVLHKAAQDLKLENEELKQRNDELNNENKSLFNFKQVINECVEKGNTKISLSRSESGVNLTSNTSPKEALISKIDFLKFKTINHGSIPVLKKQTYNLKSNSKLTEDIEEMIGNLENSSNKKIYSKEKNSDKAKETLNRFNLEQFDSRKGDGNYYLCNSHYIGTPSHKSRADVSLKNKNLNIQLTNSSKASHKTISNQPIDSLQDYLSKSSYLNPELEPSGRNKAENSRIAAQNKEMNNKLIERQRNLLLYMKSNYDSGNYSQILKIMSKFNVIVGNKTNKSINRKSCINQILQILQVIDPDIMGEFSICFS